MTPELLELVKKRWNLLVGRQLRPCGCIWVIAHPEPYRSVYCAQHAPVVQALMDCRTVR